MDPREVRDGVVDVAGAQTDDPLQGHVRAGLGQGVLVDEVPGERVFDQSLGLGPLGRQGATCRDQLSTPARPSPFADFGPFSRHGSAPGSASRYAAGPKSAPALSNINFCCNACGTPASSRWSKYDRGSARPSGCG